MTHLSKELEKRKKEEQAQNTIQRQRDSFESIIKEANTKYDQIKQEYEGVKKIAEQQTEKIDMLESSLTPAQRRAQARKDSKKDGGKEEETKPDEKT